MKTVLAVPPKGCKVLLKQGPLRRILMDNPGGY